MAVALSNCCCALSCNGLFETFCTLGCGNRSISLHFMFNYRLAAESKRMEKRFLNVIVSDFVFFVLFGMLASNRACQKLYNLSISAYKFAIIFFSRIHA